jgi:hypothetical protein
MAEKQAGKTPVTRGAALPAFCVRCWQGRWRRFCLTPAAGRTTSRPSFPTGRRAMPGAVPPARSNAGCLVRHPALLVRRCFACCGDVVPPTGEPRSPAAPGPSWGIGNETVSGTGRSGDLGAVEGRVPVAVAPPRPHLERIPA